MESIFSYDRGQSHPMKAMQIRHFQFQQKGKNYANFIVDFRSSCQSGVDIMVVRSDRFLISRFPDSILVYMDWNY